MTGFLKGSIPILVAIGLGGCVSYPYASSFASCDADAGACYRFCEDYADDDQDYGACHADCEAEADRCFADAYDPYRYAGGPRYVSPWYGRYGAWYPDSGYVVSLGVIGRYGYGRRSYGGRRHRHHDHNRRRAAPAPAPPQAAPPPPPPQTAPPPRSDRRNAPNRRGRGNNNGPRRDEVQRHPD